MQYVSQDPLPLAIRLGLVLACNTVQNQSPKLSRNTKEERPRTDTNDDVRSTRTFGYTYPELPDRSLTPDQLYTSVATAVNNLYNPDMRSNQTFRRWQTDRRVRSANLAEAFSDITLDGARNLNVNNLNRQWFISVLVDKFAYSTSFCIDFFMGDASDDVSTWSSAANLIGTYAQFGPVDVAARYPGSIPQAQVRGQVSMTHTLAAGVSRGILRDLRPRTVVPLLQTALTWRARTASGDEIPVTDLTGLSISVSTRKVVPRTAQDQFPEYGPIKWLSAATEGKPCGA